jgi:Flp pilus assembly protein TadD
LAQFREALRLKPDAADVMNNMAWILATDSDAKIRNGAEAVRLAERASELTERKLAMFIGTLAAAYAEAGKFDQAVKAGEEAAEVAAAAGEEELAETNRKFVEQYRAQKPYREQR